MSARVKPRLRWNSLGREWTCSDSSECMAYGWGPTREAAYEAWLKKFAAWRRRQPN